MRKLFSILLIGVLATAIGCEDEPNYPIIPYIEFKEFWFEETPAPEMMDSLVLTIKFRDGDNDLGIDPLEHSFPYHWADFFLANNGELSPVSTWVLSTTEASPRVFDPVIYSPSEKSGKLATIKTKSEPGYEFMPSDEFPYSCMNYIYESVYIEQSNVWMIDDTDNIIETIDNVTPPLFLVAETFYTEYNENQFNIIIDFLVEQPDGSFNKFDWRTNFCATFDGRFSNKSASPFTIKKTSRWEGQLTYAMKSSYFITLFKGKKLKLRIYIKDRAFHNSNVIETDVIQF